MRLSNKVLILILGGFLAISGIFVAGNILANSFSSQLTGFSSQSASSTVYIENGVSGAVTLTDPYLKKTVIIDISYYPLDTGSGVVVTNDGYIITAFHVIADPQTLKNQKILKKMEDSDIKQYIEQAAVAYYLSKYNSQLGVELLNNNSSVNGPNLQMEQNMGVLTDLLIEKNLISANSYKQVIKVKFPASLGIANNPLNAELVDVGDPNTDEDVALLKINPGNKNLPALAISSQKPTINENVRIYGYPANASGVQSQTNQSLTPSTTSGSVIAKTLNSLGTAYYETNAPTAEGYSGGPVLNARNGVMGIVIYGVETRKHFTQQIGSQSSVFLSSEYLIQICKKNNVAITVI